MRHLPKHLRERWRYLAATLETWPDADLEREAFQRSLWFAAQNLVGDVGSAAADLRVVDFAHDDGTGWFVVRTRRGETGRARAALSCVDAVYDAPVRVTVRGVSGTIRAATEKYLAGRETDAREESVVFRGETRRATVRDDLIDVAVDGTLVGATRLDTA
ncbi:MAG: Rpp14/Pop5 family protein [Halanaeroarchaeum sp.]